MESQPQALLFALETADLACTLPENLGLPHRNSPYPPGGGGGGATWRVSSIARDGVCYATYVLRYVQLVQQAFELLTQELNQLIFSLQLCERQPQPSWGAGDHGVRMHHRSECTCASVQ